MTSNNMDWLNEFPKQQEAVVVTQDEATLGQTLNQQANSEPNQEQANGHYALVLNNFVQTYTNVLMTAVTNGTLQLQVLMDIVSALKTIHAGLKEQPTNILWTKMVNQNSIPGLAGQYIDSILKNRDQLASNDTFSMFKLSIMLPPSVLDTIATNIVRDLDLIYVPPQSATENGRIVELEGKSYRVPDSLITTTSPPAKPEGYVPKRTLIAHIQAAQARQQQNPQILR